MQVVRVRKRAWRTEDFEVGWEKVMYLTPSTEDRGHWVMKEREAPRVTKCIVRPTLEPEDERHLIAPERDAEDAWALRRRLREKAAVRRMDASMEGSDGKEEEIEEHKKKGPRRSERKSTTSSGRRSRNRNRGDQDHPPAEEDDSQPARRRFCRPGSSVQKK